MNHAFRGAVTAWLALIALQTLTTQSGSGRIASLFADVDRLVKRALDPTVPAIPDLRTSSNYTPTFGPGTPFSTAPSGPVIAGAHPGSQINPTTGAAVGFGY